MIINQITLFSIVSTLIHTVQYWQITGLLKLIFKIQ